MAVTDLIKASDVANNTGLVSPEAKSMRRATALNPDVAGPTGPVPYSQTRTYQNQGNVYVDQYGNRYSYGVGHEPTNGQPVQAQQPGPLGQPAPDNPFHVSEQSNLLAHATTEDVINVAKVSNSIPANVQIGQVTKTTIGGNTFISVKSVEQVRLQSEVERLDYLRQHEPVSYIAEWGLTAVAGGIPRAMGTLGTSLTVPVQAKIAGTTWEMEQRTDVMRTAQRTLEFKSDPLKYMATGVGETGLLIGLGFAWPILTATAPVLAPIMGAVGALTTAHALKEPLETGRYNEAFGTVLSLASAGPLLSLGKSAYVEHIEAQNTIEVLKPDSLNINVQNINNYEAGGIKYQNTQSSGVSFSKGKVFLSTDASAGPMGEDPLTRFNGVEVSYQEPTLLGKIQGFLGGKPTEPTVNINVVRGGSVDGLSSFYKFEGSPIPTTRADSDLFYKNTAPDFIKSGQGLTASVIGEPTNIQTADVPGEGRYMKLPLDMKPYKVITDTGIGTQRGVYTVGMSENLFQLTENPKVLSAMSYTQDIGTFEGTAGTIFVRSIGKPISTGSGLRLGSPQDINPGLAGGLGEDIFGGVDLGQASMPKWAMSFAPQTQRGFTEESIIIRPEANPIGQTGTSEGLSSITRTRLDTGRSLDMGLGSQSLTGQSISLQQQSVTQTQLQSQTGLQQQTQTQQQLQQQTRVQLRTDLGMKQGLQLDTQTYVPTPGYGSLSGRDSLRLALNIPSSTNKRGRGSRTRGLPTADLFNISESFKKHGKANFAVGPKVEAQFNREVSTRGVFARFKTVEQLR